MAGDVPSTPFGPLSTGTAPSPTGRSYWVIEHRLLAGAYPFAADARRGVKVLTSLLNAGVDTFVDLTQAGTNAVDGHLAPYADRLPPDRRHLAHPIRDMRVPTAGEMRTTLDAIDDALRRGETVYVHCWGGLGRTGMVVACWLLRHGTVGPDEVLDRLTEMRRSDRGAGDQPAPQTWSQRRFILAWPVGG